MRYTTLCGKAFFSVPFLVSGTVTNTHYEMPLGRKYKDYLYLYIIMCNFAKEMSDDMYL